MAWRRLLQRLVNTMTKLVDRGWNKELCDALASDSSHVRIISPFIKVSAIKNLLAHKPGKLQVITRFNLADFAAGVSDLGALRRLMGADAQVRGIQHLHAKLYVFGSKRSIITSANLTGAGLSRNFELGTVTSDVAMIRDCQRYFDDLWEQAKPLQNYDVGDWDKRIAKYQLRGGRANDSADLDDYGTAIGLETAALPKIPAAVDPAQQAFVKFLGRSKDDRWLLARTTFDAIKRGGCHWALSYGAMKTPRSVQDGAVMFIGRFTREPNDIRVFGRAVGMKYMSGRDDATPDDFQKRPWKKDYPRYIRVHGAEFIAGTLANAVSLNDLMSSLGSDSFASTQHNAKQDKGNVDPKRAYLQQAAVRLSAEGHAWLAERLQEAFETHGKVSQDELDTLDWPEPV